MSKLSSEDHDDAEVKFLRIELAELEKLSELRLKLAKAELLLKRKRVSAASTVIPSIVTSSSNSSSGKQDPKDTKFQFKGPRNSAYGRHLYGDDPVEIMKQEVLGEKVLKKSKGKKKTILKDSNEENIDIPEVIIYDITYYYIMLFRRKMLLFIIVLFQLNL